MYVYICMCVCIYAYIFIYSVPTSQRTQFFYKDKSVHDISKTLAGCCDNHTSPMSTAIFVSHTQRCLM